MKPYDFTQGTIPLLVSIPHAGTRLTPEVEHALSPEAASLPDTDWHIPTLYRFAHDMGASVLAGHYSRFVIDLNRPPDDQPLYTTATTGLYPDTLFDGTPAFLPGKAPDAATRTGYLADIWQPYHQQLAAEIARLKAQFGYVVIYDAHSIASLIPRLFDGQLPDINIGTNGGLSCAPSLGKTITGLCASQQAYTWVLNGRFKGGYITRHYGNPAQHQHAIQIELAQQNYMSEQYPFAYDADNAPRLQALLREFLTGIARQP